MYWILAALVVMTPTGVVLLAIKNLRATSVFPEHFRTLLPYSVLVGMAVGLILRRRGKRRKKGRESYAEKEDPV